MLLEPSFARHQICPSFSASRQARTWPAWCTTRRARAMSSQVVLGASVIVVVLAAGRVAIPTYGRRTIGR